MPDNTALISGKSFLATLDSIELIITADFFNARIIDYKVMNYIQIELVKKIEYLNYQSSLT